jgi:hypothetical protein
MQGNVQLQTPTALSRDMKVNVPEQVYMRWRSEASRPLPEPEPAAVQLALQTHRRMCLFNRQDNECRNEKAQVSNSAGLYGGDASGGSKGFN